LRRGEDVGLRLLALERLGPLGHPFAREALECGTVEVVLDVLDWEGTFGTIHGHRVIVRVDESLFARVSAVPAAVDALTSAVAAAVAQTAGHALAELKIQPRTEPRSGTPYRGGT
jgi:hypothetical protein